MSFSTWTALKNQMLDDLASNNTTHGSYTDPTGRTLNYRSFLDWQRLFEFVEKRARIESGTSGPQFVSGRVRR